MVSLPGNEEFPIPHTPHPQCPSCAEEDYQEALRQIKAAKEAIAFQGCDGLLEKYKRLKGKLD
jgi:hypothetical protein